VPSKKILAPGGLVSILIDPVAGIVGYRYPMHPGVISKTKVIKRNNNKYLYFLNIIKNSFEI
jgi:hypothetical protein